MKNRRVLLSAAAIAASAGLVQAQSFSESFDDITTLPGADWFEQNNSNPIGVIGYFQGNTAVFGPEATAGYLGVNFNSGGGLATISNWKLLPTRNLHNGDILNFWARSIDEGYPDRLQVRMSSNGTSTNVGSAPTDVGDFTSLLLDINPTYQNGVFVNVWTQYSVVVSGLPAGGANGRLAFRYFCENGGPSGGNSDYIGIDELEYIASGGAPVGACCLPATLTCAIRSQTDCTSQGGTYRGDNTDCATANCPTPGACCMPNGTCNQSTSAACTTAGGVYRGDSTSCATAACPGGFTMDCSIPGTFTDISATGTPITTGDDVAAPFTSSVTNALVTNASLYACTNGFISDSATFATFTNATLPTASCGFGLFPNWDDLYVDPATTPPGSLVHQGVVEGGVNVEVIQWNMVRPFAGTAQGTFEVKIFASGPAPVQYLYQSMAWDGNGNSSTVGVQWAAGAAYQKSFNATGSIPDNSVCSVIPSGLTSCYANCDHSTQQPCLNVLDFSCFLNAFAAGATYANCDNSTQVPILNVLDFSCFLNRFAAGCSNC